MPYTGIVKYHVKLSFEVDGLVERADIIGAIFGQTEGLLGPEMNLNELQRVSKVGRIEVNTFNTENTTKGDALLPMSTDIDTCSLIAAAIESIDKVGPFDSSFKLDAIDDVRASKKEDIVKSVYYELNKLLIDNKIEAEITGREKTPFSIWRKMQSKRISLEQLTDIVGFRVIVKNIND